MRLAVAHRMHVLVVRGLVGIHDVLAVKEFTELPPPNVTLQRKGTDFGMNIPCPVSPNGDGPGGSVGNVAVQVPRLRVGHGDSHWRWIWLHESSQRAGIMPRSKIVVARLRISFFAGEFVAVVGLGGDDALGAEGVVVRNV